MSETVITSIAEFHEQLGQLKHKDAVFLYRGQANATWPVDCSAARRLAADPANPIETQLIRHLLVGYLDILISTTRMRGFLPPGFSESISDLELLAHLQHQGAATGLIDFTRQPLVALWFACHESLDTDGAIYVLDRSQTEEISKREDIENKTIQSIYAEIYAKDKLWSWEPSGHNNRIAAQSSVFVFGVPEIARTNMTELKVRAESKRAILTELETMCDINEEKLFADFPGYAVANASNKTFDVKRSIRYWQKQIELASEDEREKATAHFNCGVAYDAINDFENAIEQYNKTIRLKPDFVSAYLNRGTIKNSLGQHQDAFADYNEALQLKLNDAAVYFNLGNAKADLGQHQAAIADYNKAIQLNPDLADAYFNRGVAKNSLGQYQDAIADYNEVLRLKPDYADAYNNRGLANISLGRHEDAFTDFDQAIRLKPDFAKAYLSRGNTKSYYLGQHQDAIADYNEAIRLTPDYADAYLNRGVAKNSLGKRDKAITDYDEAIRLNPDVAEAYNNRGVAKNGLDQHEKAIEDYDKAIQLQPDYSDAYGNRGIAKQNLERYEEAIEDYDEAIKRNSNFVEFYHGRGVAKCGLDRYEDALTDFDKFIQLKPNYAYEPYFYRGFVKNKLDKHKEAIEDYNEAIILNPNFAEAYLNRGLSYLAVNQPEEARRDLETAHNLAQQAGKEDLVALADQELRNLDAPDEGE